MTPQEKLEKLLLYYRDNPIEFVRQVFQAEPTQQQIDLILSATQSNSRCAVKSATATGKTTALVWLTYYFLICYPDCKGLVTAPTSSQINRVFRSELVLWQRKMVAPFKSFFEIMNEKIFVIGKKDTQFFSWITGSAENKESFAGLHAEKVVLMVDEASALPKEIFDTLYGTLSSGDTSFILVSNPVRAEGAFYDLFAKGAPGWETFTFTSFDSPNVDKGWIKEIREYYGEDSDFYKMRVLGQFPILSEAQFISTDLVEEAMKRTLVPSEYLNFPRVLGCDVARFGDDSSVIVDRQGPKIHGIQVFKGLDTILFSREIIRTFRTQGTHYDHIAVDGIGIGSGVVDQLKHQQMPVIDVNVSTKSSDPKTYFNLRSQIWGEMRIWLSTGSIGYNDQLRTDLIGINYSYNNKMQIILEAKKDLKRRGLKSPDLGDALALTFASSTFQYSSARQRVRPVIKSNYMWI